MELSSSGGAAERGAAAEGVPLLRKLVEEGEG